MAQSSAVRRERIVSYEADVIDPLDQKCMTSADAVVRATVEAGSRWKELDLNIYDLLLKLATGEEWRDMMVTSKDAAASRVFPTPMLDFLDSHNWRRPHPAAVNPLVSIVGGYFRSAMDRLEADDRLMLDSTSVDQFVKATGGEMPPVATGTVSASTTLEREENRLHNRNQEISRHAKAIAWALEHAGPEGETGRRMLQTTHATIMCDESDASRRDAPNRPTLLLPMRQRATAGTGAAAQRTKRLQEERDNALRDAEAARAEALARQASPREEGGEDQEIRRSGFGQTAEVLSHVREAVTSWASQPPAERPITLTPPEDAPEPEKEFIDIVGTAVEQVNREVVQARQATNEEVAHAGFMIDPAFPQETRPQAVPFQPSLTIDALTLDTFNDVPNGSWIVIFARKNGRGNIRIGGFQHRRAPEREALPGVRDYGEEDEEEE